MKKMLLTLAVMATLSSCKKNADELIVPQPEKELSKDIALTVKGATRESQPAYQATEAYNFLGFGYDVTDKFNDEISIRKNVIDIVAFANANRSNIGLNRSTESSWTTILGNDALNLSERLSNQFEATKGLRVFGSTMEKSFPETTYQNSDYVYGYYSYYMIRKSLRFYYDRSVNNFITNEFKQDVASLPAELLVKKYGTHVLSWIDIGAKFDVVYQAKAGQGNREKISMEGQRYAMKHTFGLPTGYADAVDLQNLNANASAKIYYSSVGGDSGKLQTETKNDRVTLNISKWIASTTEDKARFMGPSERGLVALYEFVDNDVKKAEIKAYIDKYLIDQSVKLSN